MHLKIFCIITLSLMVLTISAESIMQDRFFELWEEIHDPANEYLSPEGLPYHSTEKLIVEAVDYGHYSTSEGISELLWLETVYAKFTGDWSYFENVWDLVEDYYIPGDAEQVNFQSYNPQDPGDLCPEYEDPYDYPSPVLPNEPVGQDPIYNELSAQYGSYPYMMHWLLDVDNWLGFDNPFQPDGRNTKIKLFERGPNESTWETIPHPAWDAAQHGNESLYDLYVQTTSPQWRYTVAPDAEMRLAQVMYWATSWADEQNVDISDCEDKMLKMGDWLRYVLFDKYHRVIGELPIAGNGYDSAHYLVSWYTSWGAGINESWAWNIGCHSSHIGYNNPLGALYLSQAGIDDWDISLARQLELAESVQSASGAFGGGVANHIAGETPFPTNTPGPFHGMEYEVNPVYLDPGSNNWSGYQFWFTERLVSYYLETGDQSVEPVLQNWFNWIEPLVILSEAGDVQIPVGLKWEVDGVLIANNGAAPVHFEDPSTQLVCITNEDDFGQDIGSIGSLSKCLILWNRATAQYGTEDVYALTLAEELLNRVWNLYRDDKGVAPPETREDYERFWSQNLPMADGVSKNMPWGDTIDNTSVFHEARPEYGEDLPPVGPYSAANPAPVYNYHRTWQQIELATAYAYYNIFIESESIYGDVNGDGEVEAYDAALVLQYAVAMIEFDEWQITNGDVDGNGNVAAYDAALILQFAVGIINEFPVENRISEIRHESLGFPSEKPEMSLKCSNHPNPFKNSTTISFDHKEISEESTVEIYNIKGQLVKSIKTRGNSVTWDSKKQASGIYFAKLKTGNNTGIKKMILLR